MLKKIAIILITTLALTVNVSAGSDGELLLKKNKPSEIKDCFEKVNRATFAFNQALDGLIFKPVSSVYKKLPSPSKNGVSNLCKDNFCVACYEIIHKKGTTLSHFISLLSSFSYCTISCRCKKIAWLEFGEYEGRS